MPDIVSKYASVKVKFNVENIKGNEPNNDMIIQAKEVIRNAC